MAFAKINGGGIIDLEIGPDGLVYIVSSNGKIMRLQPLDANATLPLIETTNVTDTAPVVGINRTDTNTTDTGNTTGTTTGATGGGGGGNGNGTTTPIGVSIVQGSSLLTDTAYQPNPVQVNLGDTVTWTNDDSTTHTVTSGENAYSDGRFDSPIMAPQQTFEHAFTEGAAGEYPTSVYYIQTWSEQSA